MVRLKLKKDKIINGLKEIKIQQSLLFHKILLKIA